MNLIEESFQNKEEKKKKRTTRIILGAILIVILTIIGIFSYLMYIQNTKLKIVIDDENKENIKSLFLFKEDGTIYVPIKEIAEYLGYESFDGEYKAESEKKHNCYIQSQNEVANFSLNKKQIYKLDLTAKNKNYEIVEIKQPIEAMDSKLYISTEGLEKAFNVSFSYDKEKNKIKIWTLPKLYDDNSKSVINYKYTELSKEFVNQKALLKGYWIVKKEDEEKTSYGVIEPTGETTYNTILEPKYDNITYLPETGDFLVEIDEKVGIVTDKQQTKVQIIYDSIELIDSKDELYIAKKDEKYGVIDAKGTTKIYIEYNEIGIDDISQFNQNDIKNKYILIDNLIPVRKGKLWGVYNKNGELIVDFKYDSFGYIASNDKDAMNLLVIPTYNVIVACKDEKYTLINSSGKEIFDPVADDIYMTISGGEKHYYIIANDQKIDAEEFLNKYGITTKDSSENKKDTKEKNKTTENEEKTKTTENEEKNKEQAATDKTNEEKEKKKIKKEIESAWHETQEENEDADLNTLRKALQKKLKENDENAKVTKDRNVLKIVYKGYETSIKTEEEEEEED